MCWARTVVCVCNNANLHLCCVIQALVKHLDNISDEDIPDVHIPTGVPLVYELGDDLKAVSHYGIESGRQD